MTARRSPSFAALLLPPIAVAVVAGAGLSVCRAARWAVDPADVAWAAAVTVLAGMLALVAPLLARRGDQMQASQAALIALVVHLLVAAGGGLAASSLIRPGPRFMYWLCAFFWATLAVVATVVARAVRAAPMKATAASG